MKHKLRWIAWTTTILLGMVILVAFAMARADQAGEPGQGEARVDGKFAREVADSAAPDESNPSGDANLGPFSEEPTYVLRATGGPWISRDEAVKSVLNASPSGTKVLYAEFMTFRELREKTRIEPEPTVHDGREVYLVVIEGEFLTMAPKGMERRTFRHAWVATDATSGRQFRGGSGSAHLEK